jgi:hypothetical protein
LRITLQSSAGEELLGGNASTALDLIPPGGRAPFGILFSSPPASFDRFLVTPVRAEASDEPANRYATLEMIQTDAGPVGPLFEVSGSVTNPGQRTVSSVTIVVTTYDPAGQVTGFRQARLTDDLSPGGSTEFSVSLMPNSGLPANHNVAVQGQLSGP